MKTLKLKRSSSFGAAIMAGALLLSACGGGGGAGGDTTCKAFLDMNESDRNQVMEAFAKQEGEDSITTEEAGMAAGIFQMMCQMVKDDSIKLKNLDDLDEGDFDLGIDPDDIEIPELDLD